jgi:hypothetical protein
MLNALHLSSRHNRLSLAGDVVNDASILVMSSVNDGSAQTQLRYLDVIVANINATVLLVSSASTDNTASTDGDTASHTHHTSGRGRHISSSLKELRHCGSRIETTTLTRLFYCELGPGPTVIRHYLGPTHNARYSNKKIVRGLEP